MKNQLIKDKIREIIELVKVGDSLEKKHVDDIIDWIESGVEIFRIKKDAIPSKHLVSYSVVIDANEEKVLLFDHKKSQLKLPSGGHVDNGEMPLEAAKRELKEEVGMICDILVPDNKNIPFFVTVDQTVGISEQHVDVSLWYVFQCNSTSIFSNLGDEYDKEFTAHQWIGFDEILETSITKFNPNMHRFIKKLKETLA